ncbi:octanoyltransferase LipM [Tepiditoga spiralis]|uniref:Octanoyltransferase LipM n=1 Tax=Tepiditoga spiralis TaxID=2108365 RepID=A0A7G1G733_9BACT|nr:biotin/lipoate A/B protein ligase family protein [Tepiditoga spiralis]BBE30683.1 octanoyltransferase LipM [Tepiditoga spiralis]
MIRLIVDDYHNGIWNMACDLAIANNVGNKKSPTTIRLYGWSSPTLSLGKHQKTNNINFEYLKEKNIEVVKRPTGGRAVLHDDEITYSFSASSKNIKLPSTVLGSYKIISKALIESLNLLNISCDVESKKKNTLSKDICYDASSMYEVTIKGKKFIGSAQYRNEKFILQHGSIPQKFNYIDYVNSFNLKNKEKMIEHLKNNVIDIYTVLNKKISLKELEETFKVGFEKIFEEEIVLDTLSNEEVNMIDDYCQKYEKII